MPALTLSRTATPGGPGLPAPGFAIRDGIAIRALLARLVAQRAVLVAQGPDVSFATTLLHADEAGLVLDAPADASRLRAATLAAHLRVEGRDREVPVRFAALSPRPFVVLGQAALRAPLPTLVERVQRREHYRAHVPMAQHVHCALPLASGPRVALPRVVDISCGGVALAGDDASLARWPRGEVREGCTLRLPEDAPVDVALQAVRASSLRGATVGCRFVAPPGAVLRSVQRYVMALERDLRRRA